MDPKQAAEYDTEKHGFIPVQIVENNSVELVLPNGFVLKINNTNPEFLF